MIAVQAVQAALLPSSTTFGRLPRRSPRASPGRCSPIRARGGSRSSGPSETSSPRGREDWHVQEALARVAEIQVLKVRIANFLDDRSKNLLWLAEDADAELDATLEDDLRAFDGAAGEEIMERLYCKLGHFNEAQTEEKWVNLIGLGIDEAASVERNGEETEDVLEAKEGGCYKTRRNVYLGFMGLIWVGLMRITVFAAPSVELDKFGALCLIFLALIVQVCYEEEASQRVEWNDRAAVGNCVNYGTQISGRQR